MVPNNYINIRHLRSLATAVCLFLFAGKQFFFQSLKHRQHQVTSFSIFRQSATVTVEEGLIITTTKREYNSDRHINRYCGWKNVLDCPLLHCKQN